MPPRTFTLPDQPVTAFSLPEQVVTAEPPITTPSGWGSYGDMWDELERNRLEEDPEYEYQPLDPKADKTPEWLKKAAAGFQSYPTAPAQETPAPTPPTDLGAGLVAPWADYGQYGGNPDEQVQSEMINPWRDLSQPGEISDVAVSADDGIRYPWAKSDQTAQAAPVEPPKAEAWSWAKKPNPAFDNDPRFQKGGALAPMGSPPQAAKPNDNDKAKDSRIGKALTALAKGFTGTPALHVDQYKPRQEQNIEFVGARFRTADDGTVWFRGMDGAEYQQNPNDPNVQRAMALDAQRSRPAQASRGDTWERIRRGE